MNDITSQITNNNQQEPSNSQPSSSSNSSQDLDKISRERENHRTKFDHWLFNEMSTQLAEENQKRKQKKKDIQSNTTTTESKQHSTCKIIDQEKANKIIKYLKNLINPESENYDSNFKSWVHNSNFNIQVVAGVEVLHKTHKNKQTKKENRENNRTRNLI